MRQLKGYVCASRYCEVTRVKLSSNASNSTSLHLSVSKMEKLITEFSSDTFPGVSDMLHAFLTGELGGAQGKMLRFPKHIDYADDICSLTEFVGVERIYFN